MVALLLDQVDVVELPVDDLRAVQLDLIQRAGGSQEIYAELTRGNGITADMGMGHSMSEVVISKYDWESTSLYPNYLRVCICYIPGF